MKADQDTQGGESSFGKRLRSLRMQKGFSQKDFAQSVKINPVQYNRYENGDIVPATETLAKLADALNVSVDYLIEGEEKDAATANFQDHDLLLLFSELETLEQGDKDFIKQVVTDLIKVRKFKQLAS